MSCDYQFSNTPQYYVGNPHKHSHSNISTRYLKAILWCDNCVCMNCFLKRTFAFKSSVYSRHSMVVY